MAMFGVKAAFGGHQRKSDAKFKIKERGASGKE